MQIHNNSSTPHEASSSNIHLYDSPTAESPRQAIDALRKSSERNSEHDSSPYRWRTIHPLWILYDRLPERMCLMFSKASLLVLTITCKHINQRLGNFRVISEIKLSTSRGRLDHTKGKIKRHNILLEWIERQRREIAGGRADTGKEGGQGRSKRASSRALRNRPATEASKPNKPPKTSGRKRKQSTARSILSPVDPAKVSKAPSKRRGPHQKISVPYDTSQEAEKTTPNSSTPESRSK